MGFLTGLFGYKHRAVITISLYDRHTRASVQVVEYSTPAGQLTDGEWLWLSLLFCSKSLYTIGDPDAVALLLNISEHSREVLQRPLGHYSEGAVIPRLLQGRVDSVAPRPGANGIAIEVIQKPTEAITIQTSLPLGVTAEEMVLAPCVFIDFLLDRLPDVAMRYLLCAQGNWLAQYYRDIGSYRDRSSVTAAPLFVANCVAAMRREQ